MAVALGVLFALACGVLWSGNTDSLSFEWEAPTQRARPGEVVTIEPTAPEQCAPNSIVFHRPAAFGRWQQTHVGQTRAVVEWWSIETRTYSETMECAFGSWMVTVPPDVDWTPIAACDISNRCVRLEIEH